MTYLPNLITRCNNPAVSVFFLFGFCGEAAARRTHPPPTFGCAPVMFSPTHLPFVWCLLCPLYFEWNSTRITHISTASCCGWQYCYWFWKNILYTPLMVRQPLVIQGLLIIGVSRSPSHKHTHTPDSVGLLWTTNQPDAETSTSQ